MVPKGIEHCPKVLKSTHFCIVEPARIAHPGENISEVISSDQTSI